MKKRVVAGLLTAMMALQTPFMALAAEPAGAEITVDAIAAFEDEMKETTDEAVVAETEEVAVVEETAEAAPVAVDKANVAYAGTVAEELVIGEGVDAQDEEATYGEQEINAMQGEDLMIYPAQESMRKSVCRGDVMNLYFELLSRGVATDRWHVNIYKGSGAKGDKIGGRDGYFDGEESWKCMQIYFDTDNLPAGTYSVTFSMDYLSNGSYVTDPAYHYYFDFYVTDSRTPVTNVSLPAGAKMNIGQATAIAVSYEPANTTDDTTTTWTNSNPNVLDLFHLDGTQQKVIETKDYGVTYITATMAGKTVQCRIAVSPEADDNFPFTDVMVKAGNWKYDSVKYVYDNGIMNGISGTPWFDPDAQLTREMFATVLYRMAGSPAVTYTNKFSDVPDGKYYSNAVIWANQKGIVSGMGDGSYFGVGNNITREQIAKMLNEYAKSCGYNVSQSKSLDSFTDKAEVSGWATGYMQWATGVGLISGKPNGDGSFRLDPKGEATRAECAKMLMMFEQTY